MASLPEESTSAPRILLVDDEAAVLRLVKTLLGRARYEVVACGGGHEALTRLHQARDNFDCVITDAIMPEMDGYDFTRAIRRHPDHGTLPILMLTRKRHPEDVKAAVAAGVTDYVLKPIDEDLLLHKVELCIRKGQGMRHVYSQSVHGPLSQATLTLDARVTAIGETDLTMRVALPIVDDVPFRLKSPVFDEIGIPVPYLRLLRCEPATDGARDLPPFEATFAFVGIGEAELKKIRGWLRKQEVQRRK